MPYHDFLYDELVQDKDYRSKLTLCIDIFNVFLAKIDLSDAQDLEYFKTCTNISRNYIIVPKKGVKKC